MKSFGLATLAAGLALIACAIGMAAYAGLELASSPELTATALLSTHAWHIAALAVPMYLALAIGFRAVLMRPIRRLETELYRVATGHLGPINLGTGIRELQAVERGANLMVKRMEMNSGFAQAAEQELAILRGVADELKTTAPRAAEEILFVASKLALAAAAVGAPAKPAAEEVPAPRVRPAGPGVVAHP